MDMPGYPTLNNDYGLLKNNTAIKEEYTALNMSQGSLDSISKEQDILINLTKDQMDVIKAINLGDYKMLLRLGVTGLNLLPLMES